MVPNLFWSVPHLSSSNIRIPPSPQVHHYKHFVHAKLAYSSYCIVFEREIGYKPCLITVRLVAVTHLAVLRKQICMVSVYDDCSYDNARRASLADISF